MRIFSTLVHSLFNWIQDSIRDYIIIHLSIFSLMVIYIVSVIFLQNNAVLNNLTHLFVDK